MMEKGECAYWHPLGEYNLLRKKHRSKRAAAGKGGGQSADGGKKGGKGDKGKGRGRGKGDDGAQKERVAKVA